MTQGRVAVRPVSSRRGGRRNACACTPAPGVGVRAARRHGRQVAAVAVARKFSAIPYAMSRDGTTYEPGRARPVLPPPRPV